MVLCDRLSRPPVSCLLHITSSCCIISYVSLTFSFPFITGLVFITDCPLNSTLHRRRWSSLPDRRCSCLEQSATARHFCAFSLCLCISAENSLPFQNSFECTVLWSDFVIIRHSNRSSYLLNVAHLEPGHECLVRENFNPLIATLKPQSNGPSYSNTVIGTLAVDGWAVTFVTARRGLGGAAAPQASPRPPTNGQCTKFVLFDVAL